MLSEIRENLVFLSNHNSTKDSGYPSERRNLWLADASSVPAT
jgi:hypothetical protein